MRRRTLLLLILVVAGVAVFGRLGRELFVTSSVAPSESKKPLPTSPDNATVPSIDPPRESKDAASPRDVVADSIVPVVASRIRGRVLDSSGASIDGAQVALDVFDLGAARPSVFGDGRVVVEFDAKGSAVIATPIVLHAEATTGFHGEFEFRDVPARR